MFFFFVLSVVDSLGRIIVLLRVSFFMIFTLAVQMIKFDPSKSSEQIMFVNIL